MEVFRWLGGGEYIPPLGRRANRLTVRLDDSATVVRVGIRRLHAPRPRMPDYGGSVAFFGVVLETFSLIFFGSGHLIDARLSKP